MIAASGRRPVIEPRKGSKVGGYSELAQMTRQYCDDPDGFMAECGKRNLVVSMFSAIKDRTSALMRAKSLRMQTAELFAYVLCYNPAV